MNVTGRKGIILVFSLLSALLSAGYGVMFTVLDDYRTKYSINSGMLGFIVAIGFFASFFAQVTIAPLADRGHARKLVSLGLLANVAGLVMMAYGSSTLALSLGRFVMGVGAGMAVPAIRRIVILADPDNLGANVGRLLSCDVGGFAAGPAISAVLVGPFGLASPFLVIAGLCLACLPIISRVDVDESDPDDAHQARFAFDLLSSRPYQASVLLGAALFLMIGTFDALWVLVLDDLKSPDWIANIGITLFALPLIFFGARGGALAQRVGPFRLGTLGLLLASGFVFLYGQMPSAGAMFALSMVHSVSDAITMSSVGVSVGMVSPPERQAGAQGLVGGVETLVGGIAAIGAGAIYESAGRAWAYGVCASLTATLAALALWRCGPTWRRRPVEPAEAQLSSAAAPSV